MKHKFTSERITHGAEDRKGHRIGGLTLAGIGLFWLAKNAGWIPAEADTPLFWPTVIFTSGICMAFFGNHRRSQPKQFAGPIPEANYPDTPREIQDKNRKGAKSHE